SARGPVPCFSGFAGSKGNRPRGPIDSLEDLPRGLGLRSTTPPRTEGILGGARAQERQGVDRVPLLSGLWCNELEGPGPIRPGPRLHEPSDQEDRRATLRLQAPSKLAGQLLPRGNVHFCEHRPNVDSVRLRGRPSGRETLRLVNRGSAEGRRMELFSGHARDPRRLGTPSCVRLPSEGEAIIEDGGRDLEGGRVLSRSKVVQGGPIISTLAPAALPESLLL